MSEGAARPLFPVADGLQLYHVPQSGALPACVRNASPYASSCTVLLGAFQSIVKLKMSALFFVFVSRTLLEKEMATHSSILSKRSPWMEGPGGLPSLGSHRVRHDGSDLAAAAACTFCVRSIKNLLQYSVV